MNAHFKRRDGAPWEPWDFVDNAYVRRQRRDSAKHRLEEQRRNREVQIANFMLQRMRPGEIPEGLPDWAKP